MPDTIAKQFHKAFAALAAATRAASAVDNGKAPRRADLEALGIDPAAFKSIQR